MATIDGISSADADAMRQDALEMISKMRSMAQQTSTTQPTATVDNNNFSELFSKAINQINDAQTTADKLQKAYELGDKKVSLSQVVIATQESNLLFQLLFHARNRAINAYKDIMNMPI